MVSCLYFYQTFAVSVHNILVGNMPAVRDAYRIPNHFMTLPGTQIQLRWSAMSFKHISMYICISIIVQHTPHADRTKVESVAQTQSPRMHFVVHELVLSPGLFKKCAHKSHETWCPSLLYGHRLHVILDAINTETFNSTAFLGCVQVRSVDVVCC